MAEGSPKRGQASESPARGLRRPGAGQKEKENPSRPRRGVWIGLRCGPGGDTRIHHGHRLHRFKSSDKKKKKKSHKTAKKTKKEGSRKDAKTEKNEKKEAKDKSKKKDQKKESKEKKDAKETKPKKKKEKSETEGSGSEPDEAKRRRTAPSPLESLPDESGGSVAEVQTAQETALAGSSRKFSRPARRGQSSPRPFER